MENYFICIFKKKLKNGELETKLKQLYKTNMDEHMDIEIQEIERELKEIDIKDQIC